MGGFEKLPIGEDYWKNYAKKENEFIQKSLNSLKNLINTDSGITKQPRLENGAVVFNYKNIPYYIHKGFDWEIVTRKEGNGKYSVRIKKWVNLPNGKEGWQTQKNGNNETFTFSANDKLTFNRQLGIALDTIIGKNRDRLPSTGGIVYNLLNGGSNRAKPQQSPTENKATHKVQKENIETKDMPKWLELDHGNFIYTVQSGDSERKIKEKLKKYTPLDYLKDVPDGIRGYNFNTIPDKKLLPGLKLVVPKKNSEKMKTISEFKKSQKSALNEMKNDSNYGSYIKKLIEQFGENHIVNVMTAYAKSETCPEDYDNQVGKFALFRYEDYYKCPSYGYHHVLYMDAGLRAFKKTGITIGQCCNPKDSGKLFLAFCVEKNRSDYRKFFDLGNRKNLKWAAYFYNGPKYVENHYDTKLKKNYELAKGTR